MTNTAEDAGVRALQRTTAAAGAALIVIAFATGLLLGLVMQGKLDADVHEIVAAHLNALLGCFWLVAVAFTLPLLRVGVVGMRRLVRLTALAAYANWLVTTVKAFLHVTGVGVTGQHANDVVFGVLTVAVVVPSLLAAGAWTWGLLGARPDGA